MILTTALLLLQVIQTPRTQSGVIVRPDTVTVGQPFEVEVTVRAPRGSTIEFPETTDSSGDVQSLDPAQVTTASDTATVEQSALYRVAAWNVGRLGIPILDIVVHDGVETRRLHIGDASVFVRSVLPVDTTLRVAKPPRDLIAFGVPWWVWVIAALVAAAIIRLIVWFWRRRRRRQPVSLDPYVIAERGFDRVEALSLVAAGERAQHAALMVDVLRQYVWAATQQGEPSLTTTELLAALRSGVVPTQRLSALLTEVDLVKFAGRTLSSERATALGAEARAIVALVHAMAAAPLEKAA